MTSICPGGGPSQIKPLTEEFQNMLASAIGDFLVSEGMDWAAPLASGLGYLAFDLLDLCATDPPALPNVDAARIAGYFNPLNPQGAVELREDMTALVGHFLWFQYCECITGPQPPPTAPVPNPPGYQTDNPQVSGSPVSGNCGGAVVWDIQTSFDANGNISQHSAGTNQISQSLWAQVLVDGGQISGTGTPYPITFTWQWLDASGVELSRNFYTQTADIQTATPVTLTFPLQGAVASVTGTAHTGTGFTGTQLVHNQYRTFCTAPPSTAMSPCCPPDPTLENLVSQVLRLEYQILSMFGGGKLPFVDSTVHANLTGTGAVSISPAAAAIRIDIVNRPTPWPDNPGTPDFLFSIGFITPFAVGTPLRGSRLVYDHQTFQYPSYTDQIGYTLPGGVTVNLVELVTTSP